MQSMGHPVWLSEQPIINDNDSFVGAATKAKQQELINNLNSVITTEDAASVHGQKGIPSMAVVNEAQLPLTDEDGDESRFAVDSLGTQYVRDIQTLQAVMSLESVFIDEDFATETTLQDVLFQTGNISSDTAQLVDLQQQTVDAIDDLAVIAQSISDSQLPDNHQVKVSNFPNSFGINNFPTQFDVSNFPSTYPLPTEQVQTLTPQKDALTEVQARTFIPDEVGTWDYKSGVSGTVNIVGRVLQITATATAQDASLTINGGDVVPVPVGRNITIEPRANLVDPEIVFTDTTAYFVELLV